MDARLWLLDLIHGPELAAPADEKRETDRKAIAELAEWVLRRICRVVGGGHSPGPYPLDIGTRMCERSAFRSPLGLAYDQLFE